MDLSPTENNFDIRIGKYTSNSGLIRVVKPMDNDCFNAKKKYKIYMGNYTSIGEGLNILSAAAHTQNVIMNNPGSISPDDHATDVYCANYKESYGDVIIGNDVWIGRDVYIRGGVTIGDGAVIGAKALVTHNVPPFAKVGGIPAKIIGYRFSSETRKRLMKIKWWEWSKEKVKKNIDLIYAPEKFIKTWN